MRSVFAVVFVTALSLSTLAKAEPVVALDGPSDQNVLRGHKDAVLSVAWSPDGKWIATAGADGAGGLWEVTTRKKAMFADAFKDLVNDVAFSADSSRVAFGSADGTIGVYDVTTKKQIALLRTKGVVTHIALNANGSQLAAGFGAVPAQIFDVATRKPLKAFGHEGFTTTIAYSPNGNLLAIGQNQYAADPNTMPPATSSLVVYETSTAKQVSAVNPAEVGVGPYQSAAFSKDGKVLYFCHSGAGAAHLDLKSGHATRYVAADEMTEKAVAPMPGRVPVKRPILPATAADCGSGFTPDFSGYFGVMQSGQIKFYDLTRHGVMPQILSIATGQVNAIKVSPDGKSIAVALGGEKDRGWMKRKNDLAPPGEEHPWKPAPPSDACVYSIEALLGQNMDAPPGLAKLSNVADATQFFVNPAAGATAFVFARNELNHVDLHTGAPLNDGSDVIIARDATHEFRVAPDGATVVDTTSQKVITQCKWRFSPAGSASFSADGKSLYYAYRPVALKYLEVLPGQEELVSGICRIDLATGNVDQTYDIGDDFVTAFAVDSANAHVIVAATAGQRKPVTLMTFDAKTGQLVRKAGFANAWQGDCAIAADGIAYTCDADHVYRFDTAKNVAVTPWEHLGHSTTTRDGSGGQMCVTVSPDQKTLLVNSDACVSLIDRATGKRLKTGTFTANTYAFSNFADGKPYVCLIVPQKGWRFFWL